MTPQGHPSPAAAAATARGWREARNILVVRLDRLGDVLMTTPAFGAIKQAACGMELTLLTSPSGAAMLCEMLSHRVRSGAFASVMPKAARTSLSRPSR